MAIPVRNVYYLLCYAWDRLEALGLTDVDAVPGNRTENLLGQVLRDGVAHLVRRGLDRGYVETDEEGRRLRGKIRLSETMQRVLLPSGRVACLVDEFSYDVPHNRVIKAAMSRLTELPSLDDGLRVSLRDHCRRMQDVTDIELTPCAFRTVQLHRNVARYAFLINVCRLVERSFVPEGSVGRRRFHPFTANEQEMGLLFEAFVRNFLRREQDTFRVAAARVPWDVQPLGGTDLTWLPDMRTDVLLTNASRRVTIEAKYYAAPYQSHRGSRKLISSHLYQLLTYLTQLRATDGPEPMGVLLYAGAASDQRLDYRLGGHTVMVRCLDLDQEWRDIHQDLLGLARELVLGEASLWLRPDPRPILRS
jgi:5-methylcytosine-specific restriction enzyme subunit McrC